MVKRGLRVLAFGYAELEEIPEDIDSVKIELIGLVGFLDPPKKGVKEAVERAKKAGIRVVMITGDNLLTAKAVASMVGIYQEGDVAIEGSFLANYSDAELYELLKRTTVVARALPEDKYRIVKVLQSYGEIVAVTGDGVNDAPALRVADLGVAMGSGAQVSKDASAMIIISGMPLPLYPTHILWLNLVTDGVVDKAYPFTKYEGDPTKEKPKRPQEVFLGKKQIIYILYTAIICTLGHYLLFSYILSKYPYELALSISFTSSVFSLWAVGIQEISSKPFLLNPIEYVRTNPYVYLGIILCIVLQTLAVYVFEDFFKVVPLDVEHLQYTLIMPVVVFLAIELRKWAEWLYNRKAW
jgi:Ca2+-transporting ATPase